MKLINQIKKLKESEIKKLVDRRIKEFKSFDKESKRGIFKEFCFCILTANFNAERSIKIQEEIADGFLTLSRKQLARKLKKLGHRFPNTRAGYIVEARKKLPGLRLTRDWLVKNIKGLGMKEASHFLRNIGFDNFAIIDFHIIDILEKNGLIERPKTLTEKRYFEIEDILKKIAKKAEMPVSELDLYLWYLETGMVLK